MMPIEFCGMLVNLHTLVDFQFAHGQPPPMAVWWADPPLSAVHRLKVHSRFLAHLDASSFDEFSSFIHRWQFCNNKGVSR
jgi:hypothetical protein